MRSFLRTRPVVADPLVRNVAALCAAAAVVGLSFGAIATAAGLPLAKTVVMSLLVYAGGAQFLAVGLVSAGGSAVAIVAAGLLLNARHLPFGLAIGTETLGATRLSRLVGSHLMTDETVAFTLAEPLPERRRRAYWLTGISLYLTWNVSSVAGALVGSALGDPSRYGVDAAFPAALFALTLPSLKDAPTVRVALGGAVLALVATPFLPAGLPVLVALLSVALALPVPRRKAAA